VAGDVNGPDRPLAQRDVFVFASKPAIDAARLESGAVPSRGRHLVVAHLQKSGVECMHHHGAAKPVAQRPCAARVVEVTVGDEQILDVLGICPGRLNVLEESVRGAPTAGISAA
jgi:hypothetical protein